MPLYQYKAIDPTGNEQNSEMQASDENEVMATLSSKNFTVVDLHLVSNKTKKNNEGEEDAPQMSSFGSTVPMSIVLNFYEQLSFLLTAGIPVHLALKMVFENIKHAELTKILKKMIFDLTEGSMLSTSLQRYPKIFPALHTHIVGIGEKTGNLDKSLLQLIDLTKERMEIEKQAVAAASYPLFMMAMSGTLCIGMIAFVFPKFEDIFVSFGSKLPPLTGFLMGLSKIINENGMAFFGGIGAVIAGLVYFFKSEAMGETREKILLNTPLLKDIFISMFVSQMTKTLGSTLKSGITLLDSLMIVRKTIPPGLRQNFLTQMIEAVREGEQLSRAIERSEFLPELVWQLISVGEKTGNLTIIMDNIFTFYKKRYNERIEKLTAVMKPGLMFFSAAIVGTMAAALFIPLFKMGSNVKRGD